MTNGYFQLVKVKDRPAIQIFPPKDGGEMFELDELTKYLERKRISAYNLVDLNKYMQNKLFDTPFFLDANQEISEDEDMHLIIEEKALQATLRFYPPSAGKNLLSKDEILRTIAANGVKHGLMESVVDDFLKDRKYCTDYVVAKATLPVHGKDAEIIYHFDTNVTARPKLNEDGSVDFHKLGNIKPVRKGDKLATLIPEDEGEIGMSVLGTEIPARKVKKLRLRHGRNIEMSEDKTEIYSQVAGHVTLVDDMVTVSDVYQVPQNVDTSTGDIEYSGSVEIPGNVLTGYSIKADGDIIVHGVVEGAYIESGGNVVLKNGMQGMGKGYVKAKGNVIAKYLENCTIEAGGGVMSDAMMHTDVSYKDKIEVTGRKGLITGGHVRTYGDIIATNLGSNMGTDTKIEIISESEMAKRVNQLEKDKDEGVAQIKKMDQIFLVYGEKIKKGEKLTTDQENSIKLMRIKRQEVLDGLLSINEEIESLNEQIDACKGVSIQVSGDVYTGVKIIIKDIMKIMRESATHCRFVREGADIRITAL